MSRYSFGDVMTIFVMPAITLGIVGYAFYSVHLHTIADEDCARRCTYAGHDDGEMYRETCMCSDTTRARLEATP